MPDEAPLIDGADAQEGAGSSMSRCMNCARFLVTVPLGIVFSIFLIFPFLILYALYFSFLQEAFQQRYLNDGMKLSGTVIARLNYRFVPLSPAADDGDGQTMMKEAVLLEIQYSSPESNERYKVYEAEPILGEGCTIGQMVELTVLQGYPRSARYGELAAYSTTPRWVALILALALPISFIMTRATVTMRSSHSTISVYEVIGESGILNLPWWSLSAVAAVSFIIAFAMFRHWFEEVNTATLHRGHDLNYVPPQRTPFRVGIRFTLDTGSASYPYLAEAMTFGFMFTCFPLFWWLTRLLLPPACIYMAIYFTWRDHFTNKVYFKKGVPTGAVVTESKSKRCNAIAYTYNTKNYKIYEFKKPDQDYHLGEQVEVLVLPDDPTSVRLLRSLQREKTFFGRLLGHTFPLLIFGGFGLVTPIAVYIPQLLSKDASLENVNPIAFGFAILFQFAVAFPYASYWWYTTGARNSTAMEVSDDGKVATKDITSREHNFV